MAITIRNKETEALIRDLGKRWGQGPSATIRRLAQTALEGEHADAQAEEERRLKAWEALMRLTPMRNPDLTWQDLEEEMDSLFDYLDPEQPNNS